MAYKEFPSKSFIVTELKTFCGGRPPFVRKTPVSKFSMQKRGVYQEFPSKISCLSVPKVRTGNPSVFRRKHRVAQIYGKKVGVVSHFSNEFVLCHTTLKFCRGTLLSSRNFPISKLFMHKSEGVSKISVQQLLSHRTEIFVEEAFCTSDFLRYRSFPRIGTREYQGLPSKIFIITEPKSFCGGSLLFFRKTPVSKVSMDERRLWHEFRSKNFCLRVPKKI